MAEKTLLELVEVCEGVVGEIMTDPAGDLAIRLFSGDGDPGTDPWLTADPEAFGDLWPPKVGDVVRFIVPKLVGVKRYKTGEVRFKEIQEMVKNVKATLEKDDAESR